MRLIAPCLSALCVGVALVPGEAGAQGCRLTPRAPAYYPAPTYYPAYAPTYVAPTHQTYDPPVIAAPIVVQEVLAPAYVFQILSAYQSPAGYYGQASAPQQQAQRAPAGPQTVRLDPNQLKELAVMLTAMNAQARGDEPPPIGGSDEPPATDGARRASGAEVRVLEQFGKSCTSCHQSPTAKGGVTLFDAEGYWKPSRRGQVLDLATIYDAVESGRMPPPGSPKVPADLLREVSHWKSGGR